MQNTIAKDHHWMNRHFDCPLEAYSGIGQMYVADERFTEGMDKIKPGLAAFINEAI